MHTILIVEDDITYGLLLKTWLEKKGFSVSTESNLARARKHLEQHKTDLVLSDLRLPDGDGTSLLEWMQQRKDTTPFIIMTGYAEISSAVQAIKMGASDYISKPVNPEELLKKMSEATQVQAHPQKTTQPQPSKSVATKAQPSSKEFVEGNSKAARQLYAHVSLVAPTNMSVLIAGASGTGKEYVANRIHALSPRRDKPFVAIDCGAMPKDLAASEFFGHVKGSFTGAVTDKTGAFVAANGGTIFLDEIGNLSYEVQVQLLRALQERKIRPVGSNKEIEVDVRLVSATNEHLDKAIEQGHFREDLYHRINEFTLHMPELKDRKEDLMTFAHFFLKQANAELSKQVEGFESEAQLMLELYHWPGNLRQMKNIIRRATLLASGTKISLQDLGDELTAPTTAESSHNTALWSEESEKEQIINALRVAGQNKSKAAKILNIDRKTLYNKLKQYDL